MTDLSLQSAVIFDIGLDAKPLIVYMGSGKGGPWYMLLPFEQKFQSIPLVDEHLVLYADLTIRGMANVLVDRIYSAEGWEGPEVISVSIANSEIEAEYFMGDGTEISKKEIIKPSRIRATAWSNIQLAIEEMIRSDCAKVLADSRDDSAYWFRRCPINGVTRRDAPDQS